MADNELGEYLRARRHVADMTLQEVADAAGVHKSDLSKMERGVDGRTGARSPDKLRRIAAAIGADVEIVLRLSGHLPSEADERRSAAAERIELAILADHTLTSDQKSYLLKTVEMVRASAGGRRTGRG